MHKELEEALDSEVARACSFIQELAGGEIQWRQKPPGSTRTWMHTR